MDNTQLTKYLHLKQNLNDLEVKLYDTIREIDKIKAAIDQAMYLRLEDTDKDYLKLGDSS